MNNLLIFFALPVATILLAIVLQKILKNPLLVAAFFFAIYLIVTFAAFDASFLVFAILYTILAYVTAVLVKFTCRLIQILNRCCRRKSHNDNNDEEEESITSTRHLTINNTTPTTTMTMNSDNTCITLPEIATTATTSRGIHQTYPCYRRR